MNDWKLLKYSSSCIYDDDVLHEHIRHALSLGFPTVGQHFAHDIVAVLVASGPSVAGQLDSIRRQRQRGRPIVAINEAHDWLIGQGIVPDFAAAIDPRPDVLKWFSRKHPDVKYLITSQCHPSTFAHLHGHQVWLWHLFTSHAKSVYPKETVMIGGGVTTGLRTITLFYTMGYRRFELYGYDSCLTNGVLRVNGDKPKETTPVVIKVGTKIFLCNPSMAQQATSFESLYNVMPDLVIQAYGGGLIAAILDERNKISRHKREAVVC